ncbi:LutC/YkgG family protein [Streptomyces sp. NBC_01465]|uniref:LutC/YkgG family protein n=1 Tax=Streptomyces sp. NBC_01465 TaxID=2903878 RepID=UPI002E373920|nr:lactate utilization protein C [Streptomyces sp. NBC_01465]
MNTRETILTRIREAVAQAPEVPEPARDYLPSHTPNDPQTLVNLLAENLTDYRAIVHHTYEDTLPDLLNQLLSAHGTQSVLVPPGLPEHWLQASNAQQIEDSSTHTPHDLDTVDSVVTGCALAIAETGTLVLDASPDQGRRRITLIPDHHICIVRAPDQIVASLPQAMPRLDPTRPLTWISGPSATSDIELDRVEGVHGPRTLEVILLSSRSGD